MGRVTPDGLAENNRGASQAPFSASEYALSPEEKEKILKGLEDFTGLDRDNPAFTDRAIDALEKAYNPAIIPTVFEFSEMAAWREKVFDFVRSHNTNQVGPIGGAQNREEKAREDRRNQERLRFSTVATTVIITEAMRQAAQAAIDEVFRKNKDTFDKAIQRYNESEHLSAQQRATILANELAPTVGEAKEAAASELGGDEEESVEMIMAKVEEKLSAEGVTKEVINLTMAKLHIRLSENKNTFKAQIQNSASGTAKLMAAGIFGIGLDGQRAEFPKTKAEIIRMMDQGLAALGEQWQKNVDDLEEIKALAEKFKSEIEMKQLELDGAMGLREASNSARELNELKTQMKEIDELLADMEEQQYILDLQKECVELGTKYTKQLLDTLNEDLSNLDIDFIKQAILGAPEDLIEKTMKLEKLSGTQSSNIFKQLREMAENPDLNISEEKRQKILDFLSDVESATQEKLEADQKIADSTIRIESHAAENPDFVDVTYVAHVQMDLNSRDTAAIREQAKLSEARDEKKQAEERLAELLGQEDEELKAPEPTGPKTEISFEQKLIEILEGKDSIPKEDLEVVISELGYEGIEFKEAYETAVKHLEDNNITVTNSGVQPDQKYDPGRPLQVGYNGPDPQRPGMML